MLRIAICDDDPQELARMQALAAEYGTLRGRQVHCEAFLNAPDFLERMAQGMQVDVCCLDIMMPVFSGMDIAKTLRTHNKDLPILFCTASPEFALAGYQVQAAGYLIKPIKNLEFFAALDEVMRKLHRDASRYLMVKNDDVVHKLALDDLVYIEVEGRRISYHLMGQTITCTGVFASTVAQLQSYLNFAMPHRSFLINLDHVTAVSAAEIRLDNGKKLAFSVRKLTAFKQVFLQYMMHPNNVPPRGQ